MIRSHSLARRLFVAAALAAGVLLARPAPVVAQDKTAELAEADRLEKDVDRLYQDGRYDEALRDAERVVAIREKGLGPRDPKLATALSDLGAMYLSTGNLLRAEAPLLRAVDMLDKVTGHEKDFATALHNLGHVVLAKGDGDRAKALYERAIDIATKAAGPDDPARATYLTSLGSILRGRKDWKAAEEKFQEARRIHEKAGVTRSLVVDLTNLGDLRAAQGRDAGEFLVPAIKLAEDKLGQSHPVTSQVYERSANILRAIRKHDLALEHFEKALKIREAALGPNHPSIADLLFSFALGRQAANDVERAVALRARAHDIEERQLGLVLASGSESAKQMFATRLYRNAEDTISLHLWSGQKSTAAARLALLTILRRKGRVLDAVSEGMSTLRKHLGGQDGKLLDDLAAARAELATLVVRGPGETDRDAFRAKVKGLEDRAKQLEDSVSARSAEYRAVTAPVTLEAVQSAIPEGAALVEIVRYTSRDAKAFSELAPGDRAQYVAYVLRRTGDPRWMYVGDSAATIETVVGQLRKALADPARRDVGDPASRLYSLVMGRLTEALGDTTQVLLAPDGALNLVPFGALLDLKSHFLVERYSFTYLASGRDLLRVGGGGASHEGAVIIANPDYDAEGSSGGAARAGGGTRSADLSRAKFSSLPGTAEEAKAIAGVLKGASLLTGKDATEAALKKVHGPRILHIATHGFFLPDQINPATRGELARRGLELAVDTARPDPKSAPVAEPGVGIGGVGGRAPDRIENPLLRSGIALAGANRKVSGDDDGVLTALEAAGLDLFGTKLVVLSACETGVGEVKQGEGVFGLRRALVIAGAETQIMSLWKVDDVATQNLMSAYYAKLQAGVGRGEAMRQVQLAMLKKRETDHPFYWGAFIVSGNPGPIDMPKGESHAGTAAGTPGRVAPAGARGCGCDVAGERGWPAAPWTLVLAFALAGRRRRWRSESP